MRVRLYSDEKTAPRPMHMSWIQLGSRLLDRARGAALRGSVSFREACPPASQMTPNEEQQPVAPTQV